MLERRNRASDDDRADRLVRPSRMDGNRPQANVAGRRGLGGDATASERYGGGVDPRQGGRRPLDYPAAVQDPRVAVQRPIVRGLADTKAVAADVKSCQLRLGARSQDAAGLRI